MARVRADKAARERRISMMAVGALLRVVAVIWSVAGCAIFLDEETRYLRSAQNHATQQEVRDRLGGPMWVVSSRTGETVWVYQIRQPEKGGNNIWTITGFWCDEYVLTFDKQSVLRQWTHKSQKHRDERTLGECVRNGFVPPS